MRPLDDGQPVPQPGCAICDAMGLLGADATCHDALLLGFALGEALATFGSVCLAHAEYLRAVMAGLRGPARKPQNN